MVKNIFLRNQEADDFETWYSALGTRVLTIFHMMTWVDLDYFYDRVKLFPNASASVKAYTALSANVFPCLF